MALYDYISLKGFLEKELRLHKDGLTWDQLRDIGKIDQKRPYNQWVRKLEKEIGLIREKKKGKTIWKL
jgi:hypothetical protein